MIVNGWTLLFHETMVGQVKNLIDAYERARKTHPKTYRSNANVKLFVAVAKLLLDVIPADPSRTEYRQGNTLGPENRHWLRAKFFNRFRLFFRYDSRARIIVYAWINDERTLRQHGVRSDPYEIFRQMLASGHPPSDWTALVRSSVKLSAEILSTAKDAGSAQREK